MSFHSHQHWLVLASLLLLLCLSACAAPSANPTAAPTQAFMPLLPTTPAAPMFTATPFSTALPTLTSSPTLSATLTPTVLPATPTRTITPTQVACRPELGRVELHQLETPLLRKPLEFRVYAPPCYDDELQRSYPTLYLIHGQSFSDDQWDRMGVDEIAGRLIVDGELPPFLIVMPRDREWTPPDVDPFGQAFIEALMPWVEQHYRVDTERDQRAIGGLSRGAGWAAHLGLKFPSLFGTIGLHSPAIFWSDIRDIPKVLDAMPIDQTPRFFIDLGDRDREEIENSAQWFEEQLTSRNIPHEWHMFHGRHDETYWQAHIEQYLRWYAAEW